MSVLRTNSALKSGKYPSDADPAAEPKASAAGDGANQGRRVTMTDVAGLAGCSQATVSLVLNNASGVKISQLMRARVIKAARELNYAPSMMAHHHFSSPATHAITDSIGFIVDQLATSPEAVVAIEGVRQAVWDDGRVVFTAQTMNDPEMEEKTVQAMVQNGVSGIVYMTIFTRHVDVPACIRKLSIPVVLVNCYNSETNYPSAVPDEIEGGFRATRHLIENGHRRIGIITGEPWMEAARDRLKGYRRALTSAGIHYDHALVVQGNWSPSAGYEQTRRMLALPNRPTAIFCQNDRMAIGCYEALKEAGLRIPDDMSVIGYDDEEISRHMMPQLSTVVLPHRAMGAWAVSKLGELERKRSPSYVKEQIECPLVARHSVKNLSRTSD
jgi:LacI family transcriptional regulator